MVDTSEMAYFASSAESPHEFSTRFTIATSKTCKTIIFVESPKNPSGAEEATKTILNSVTMETSNINAMKTVQNICKEFKMEGIFGGVAMATEEHICAGKLGNSMMFLASDTAVTRATENWCDWTLNPSDSKVYLIFLSNGLAEYFQEGGELYVKGLMEEGTTIRHPAMELVSMAIMKMKRNKVHIQDKFKHVSALVVDLKKCGGEMAFSLELTKKVMGDCTVYCSEDRENGGCVEIVPYENGGREGVYLRNYRNIGEGREEMVLNLEVNRMEETSSVMLTPPPSSTETKSEQLELEGMEQKLPEKPKKRSNLKRLKCPIPSKMGPSKIKKRRKVATCQAIAVPPPPPSIIPPLPPPPWKNDVMANLIQWRAKVPRPNPFLLYIPTDTRGSPKPPQMTAFSLNLDSLDPSITYLLYCSKTSNMLLHLPPNEIQLPDSLQFYPLPDTTRDPLWGFHMSENIADKVGILRGISDPVANCLKEVLSSLNLRKDQVAIETGTGELREGAVGRILDRYIREDLELSGKEPDKQLLFEVPLIGPQVGEDNMIKVCLLKGTPKEEKRVVPWQGPPVLEGEKTGDSKISMGPLPDLPEPAVPVTPVIKAKTLPGTTTKFVEMPKKVVRRVGGDGSLKSSLSVAFLNRGCGGKCIIPGAVKKPDAEVKERADVKVKREVKVEPGIKQEIKSEVATKSPVKLEVVKQESCEGSKEGDGGTEPDFVLRIPDGVEEENGGGVEFRMKECGETCEGPAREQGKSVDTLFEEMEALAWEKFGPVVNTPPREFTEGMETPHKKGKSMEPGTSRDSQIIGDLGNSKMFQENGFVWESPVNVSNLERRNQESQNNGMDEDTCNSFVWKKKSAKRIV